MARVNVSELLGRIEIDQVAEKLGMRLQDDGRSRKMTLCPFHDDKTPSLLIDTSRDHDLQHFHCFACGEHGTAIDLTKEKLGTDFNGAVEWLETTFGLKTRPTQISSGELRQTGLERAYEIYSSESEKNEFDVWAASRKFDSKFLTKAGLLYVKSGALTNSKRVREATREARIELMNVLEDAGLVRKLLPSAASSKHLDTGSEIQFTDTFIGDRVLVPIRDQRKKLVGVAGRAAGPLQALQKAKYLFSKNFPKSRSLYRADSAFVNIRALAKRGIHEIILYVCEGFFDALRFESLGQPAVAVMGASISKDQVQLLRELSESLTDKQTTITIALCLDRDEAGLRGAAASAVMLLDAGLDVAFVWPSSKALTEKGFVATAKDPDAYLADANAISALELLGDSMYSPGLAILANQFGLSADDVLDHASWENASQSRKHRAFEKALAEFRKIRLSDMDHVRRWIGEINVSNVSAINDWLNYIDARSLDVSSNSNVFLESSTAGLNHARLLAYRGSRRGELACDEPRWERLDIGATAFNVVLTEHMSRRNAKPIGPFDAVWVPRSFGSEDPRLKVMPRAEDLIIHQYLLNEILSEKWDINSIGVAQFSQHIPAVRYYREEQRTITTGFAESLDNREKLVRDGAPLSFAYQIDMDVLEGRQPASDQGMFRPYQECWHDFMQSLNNQANSIGHVHVIRLDVSRYYDRIRRSVMRDALQSKIQAAFESLPGETTEFASLLGEDAKATPSPRAALLVDRLADQIFGYPYYSPDNGQVRYADPMRGIPQGPVISAWIGTILLFSVDQIAADLMARYNNDGATRLGYARYVDDIVLLAESASLLEVLRDAVDAKTRSLELTLVAKADSIPPMTSGEFSKYLNEGRVLDASGPTWSPPIVGDGEAGWDFWSAAPSSNRQSALQLLSNLDLYKAAPNIIIDTVRTAFLATDLRATELAKGARLIWYAVAAELTGNEETGDISPRQAWNSFVRLWEVCTVGAGWNLNPERNKWESLILFALEGLEKLIDHTGARLRGLTTAEDNLRQLRILTLAHIVLKVDFREYVFASSSILERQTGRRLELLEWKALKTTRTVPVNSTNLVDRSLPFHGWEPFDWFHSAIEQFGKFQPSEKGDPLTALVVPFKSLDRSLIDNRAGKLFSYLLPHLISQDSSSTALLKLDADLATAALQTIAAVAPRDSVFTVLTARPQLLELEQVGPYLFMPPLPGITQKYLVACQLDEAHSSQDSVRALITYEFANEDDRKLNFLGANETSPIQIELPWTDEKLRNETIVQKRAPLPSRIGLKVREKPLNVKSLGKDFTLKSAALLYRRIVNIVVEYSRQHPGLELVPAWPYITEDEYSNTTYLLSDGVNQKELGNRAFIRDGSRALCTVEVPIFEAHLWRAGMALSDYLGFHDDITKFKSNDSEMPFDDNTHSKLALYVLRTQCRKLRGSFADSKIAKKIGPSGVLPASIERALSLLENFPDQGSTPDQLKYVLATEAETVAMRIRLQSPLAVQRPHDFLRTVAGIVLSSLPLAIGEPLSIPPRNLEGLRRDFAGLLAFSRCLWTFPDKDGEDLVSWRCLRAGVILLGARIGIEGMLTSLRSNPNFVMNESYDFPVDWEIPTLASVDFQEVPVNSSLSNNASLNDRGCSTLELLRQLVRLLAHRLRSTHQDGEGLSIGCVSRIKSITRTIAQVEYSISESEDVNWPFAAITESTYELLKIAFLESLAEMLRTLDRELGMHVSLVQEQAYGFNAQNQRFTDSKNRTWDFKAAMISQFPLRAKSIEEVHFEGQVRRVWSEIHDKKSGRLLSVSVLAEPFASIALTKMVGEDRPEDSAVISAAIAEVASPPTSIAHDGPSTDSSQQSTQAENIEDSTVLNPVQTQSTPRPVDENGTVERSVAALGSERKRDGRSYVFRWRQQDEWSKRRELKNSSHVRVAILQWNLALTYLHPMCECSPRSWPMGKSCKQELLASLEGEASKYYASLGEATKCAGNGHYWKHEEVSLKSWAEHRRRRILERAINACENFGVDLLILPEYSVRRETVEWLKTFLSGRKVAVLAGTYMEFSENAPRGQRSNAMLNLIWPVPDDVLHGAKYKATDPISKESAAQPTGKVLHLHRAKKYRSVGLSEFIRPSSKPMAPLFIPTDLVDEIASQLGMELSSKGIVKLLGSDRLPLRYFIELICSEIFLLTSPANYPQLGNDYLWARRRFGETGGEKEVLHDVHGLSQHLSFGSSGDRSIRRSIVTVPAATTRTADYWIAGQAALLAAGTTTVFCNGVGADLKGGSCFIGRESWKSTDNGIGYISSITPYHGWSKGIYYNTKNDPLSPEDQALVIADIDPVHMLEGKPRPQLLPVPLQLVAYLPIAEVVDVKSLNSAVCQAMNVSTGTQADEVTKEELPRTLHSRESFWDAIANCTSAISTNSIEQFSKFFSDPRALCGRLAAAKNDGKQQPYVGEHGASIVGSPAFYDWLDVDLSLDEGEEIPEISVPPWA